MDEICYRYCCILISKQKLLQKYYFSVNFIYISGTTVLQKCEHGIQYTHQIHRVCSSVEYLYIIQFQGTADNLSSLMARIEENKQFIDQAAFFVNICQSRTVATTVAIPLNPQLHIHVSSHRYAVISYCHALKRYIFFLRFRVSLLLLT